MPPPKIDDPFFRKFLELQLDTLEALRSAVAAMEIKVAVLQTKNAMLYAAIGLAGSIIGAIVSGVVLHLIRGNARL